MLLMVYIVLEIACFIAYYFSVIVGAQNDQRDKIKSYTKSERVIIVAILFIPIFKIVVLIPTAIKAMVEVIIEFINDEEEDESDVNN